VSYRVYMVDMKQGSYSYFLIFILTAALNLYSAYLWSELDISIQYNMRMPHIGITHLHKPWIIYCYSRPAGM